MDSKKPLYKSISFWLMVLFLLYSALGFLAVPYYLKNQLSELSQSELNSNLIVDEVRFNPYTIAVNLSGLSLTDTDNTQWFKADEIHANLDFWKTLFNHYSLSKIHLENPQYRLYLNRNKNDVNLKYPKLNNIIPQRNEAHLSLDINDFSINKGGVFFVDGSAENVINLNITNIHLHQTAFSTADTNIPFNLSFMTESNYSTEITGFYNIPRSHIDVDWKIKNWATSTLIELLNNGNDSLYGLINHGGHIDANGHLNYSTNLSKQSSISIQKLLLNNFESTAVNKEAINLQIPQLVITGAAVDLNTKSISIKSIDAKQNNFSLGLSEENEPLWNPQKKQLSHKKATEITENNWQLNLQKLNLKDSKFSILKPSGKNILHLENFSVKDFSNIKGQSSEITFVGSLDGSGQLNALSHLQLSPLEYSSELKLIDIDLSKWQAWIPKNLHVHLQKGLLSANQFIAIKDFNVISRGWVKLEKTKLVDNKNHEFFSIDQLLIEKNNVNFKEKSIILDNITFNHAHGDLLVSEEKTLNVAEIMNNYDNESSEKVSEPWHVIIKSIAINDAQTSITDKSVQPHFHTQVSKIQGNIQGLSSQNLSKADVKLSGVLDTYGKLSITGKINPLSEQAFTDLAIDISNLDMQNFSSYSKRYLGFPLLRGKADFALQYKLNQYILNGKNNLTFNQLKFGDKSNSTDAINLPLKLAVNLLTDGNGVMQINLPVSGNINDPNFSYGGLVFKAFFKLITGIVASPFKLLGKLIPNGADLDLSGIQFIPGLVELNSGEESKLNAMQKIMQKRTQLNLELTPIINSIEDEKALKQKQLLKQLKLASRPESTDIDTIKNAYINLLGQQNWDLIVKESNQEKHLNQAILVEKAWIELLQLQDVKELLNQLSNQRAQFIQSQLIDKFSIPQERIFIRNSETSETLFPQVKFGIADI